MPHIFPIAVIEILMKFKKLSVLTHSHHHGRNLYEISKKYFPKIIHVLIENYRAYLVLYHNLTIKAKFDQKNIRVWSIKFIYAELAKCPLASISLQQTSNSLKHILFMEYFIMHA
jgi:hypothetical protein